MSTRASRASRTSSQGEGINDPYKVIHQFQSMVLLDKIVGDAKHSIVLGADKRSRHHAEPALDGQPRQPGVLRHPRRRTQRRRLRRAPRSRRQGAQGQQAEVADLRRRDDAADPAARLDRRVRRPGPPRRPGAVVGQRQQPRLSAVTPVTVPAADPTLTFDAKYGAEAGYDYGYVQVSTDGGATYTSIAGDKTVDGPLGPALNGTTTGFEPHTFDLSAYAGQDVLLSFRYVSDGGVNEGGLLVDDIAVGGTTISDGSSLAPFKSPTRDQPAGGRRTGTSSWSASAPARSRRCCRSSGTAATTCRWTGATCSRRSLRQGRRDRRDRRPVGAGPAVRAVHPEGQRRHPAGRQS